MNFSFPNGIHVDVLITRAYCATCGGVFKRGETLTLGSDGSQPYRWEHKECYEKSNDAR